MIVRLPASVLLLLAAGDLELRHVAGPWWAWGRWVVEAGEA
jgi:hypothetical protein